MEQKSNLYESALLPALNSCLSIASATGQISSTNSILITAAFLAPMQMFFSICSNIEKRRLLNLIENVKDDLKSTESRIEYFKTEQGLHNLYLALKASAAKDGKERMLAIKKVLLNSKELDENINFYKAADFFQSFESLNENEIVLLNVAFELVPEGQRAEREMVVMPAISEWTDLHNKFPNLTPHDLAKIFDKLNKSPYISKHQGFYGDNGDTYSFSPMFLNLKSMN